VNILRQRAGAHGAASWADIHDDDLDAAPEVWEEKDGSSSLG
jgi:hypothetical protein